MNQIPNIEETNSREIEEVVKLNRTCGCTLGWCKECLMWKGVIELTFYQQLQKAREDAQAEYRQFVLNVLDGIDIADGRCNTKAIRFALQSRIIHSELDQPINSIFKE